MNDNKIKSLYDYVFYRFYRRFINSRDAHQSATLASINFSLLVSFNITAIWNFICYFSSLDLYLSKWVGIVLLLIVIGLNYVYFVNNERYLTIEEKYNDETEEHRQMGIVCTILYVLLSFSMAIIFGVITHRK
jgi:Ca2+/Na+ antiporter